MKQAPRAHRPLLLRRKQQGVAVVTALLLTTLAVTIVASLFWQQQVQVRSMENQRLQLQTKWILRGALDWLQLILREDMRTPPLVDHPGKAWNAGLAETRLDDYVEKDKNAPASENSDASVSGTVIDAQSRYNLANLATNTEITTKEYQVYFKLLELLQIDTKLARVTAQAIAATQIKPPGSQAGAPPPAADAIPSGKTDDKQPAGFIYLEDLLSIPGYTPEILAKLRDHVIFLPRIGSSITSVNVNSTSPEVLTARIPTIDLALAKSLLAEVKRGVFFKDVADFRVRRQGMNIGDGVGISTTTNFFLVTGKVKLERATLESQILLERGNHLPTGTKILWVKEN